MSATDVSERKLEILADRIRSGHKSLGMLLERSLRQAIAMGHDLLEAKFLVPTGEWTEWVEKTCGLNAQTASHYMRYAHYEEILPEGLNIKEARHFLRGLPAADGRVTTRSYPDALKTEARRRRQAGDRWVDIGRDLGVHPAMVRKWCVGQKSRILERANKRRLMQAAKRELLREEMKRAAMKRGGAIASSYSLLRRLAQELDRASMEVGGEERQLVRQALSDVHGAESRLCMALGINYGQWRSAGFGEDAP